jgi:hypothetical protein
MDKAFRSATILGQHAEWIVCYVLARDGFDTARCDEVGIDVIAAIYRVARYMGQVSHQNSRHRIPQRQLVSAGEASARKVPQSLRPIQVQALDRSLCRMLRAR